MGLSNAWGHGSRNEISGALDENLGEEDGQGQGATDSRLPMLEGLGDLLLSPTEPVKRKCREGTCFSQGNRATWWQGREP